MAQLPPEDDIGFLQWLIGGIVTFLVGWNLFTERRLEKIKDIAHERCVDKISCKEDRDHFEKSVDEMKKIMERGFRDISGNIKSVHKRIDEVLKP